MILNAFQSSLTVPKLP